MARVLIPLPDSDFDTTEVAVPWRLLCDAGHEVIFATEATATPGCDPLLLTGVLFGQLGADAEAREFYRQMLASAEFQRPIAWKQIVAGDYDALLLPGGVAEDRNYLSARWPGDAYLLAKRLGGSQKRAAGVIA